ncbi:MAG: DUF308 domain-containing protein [Butyrivibrio sp.]|nr:DUF308 domain-containing protein [Butyrivibrio sp.]
MDKIKKIDISMFIGPLLMIVIGLVLIFWSRSSLAVIAMILAVLLVLVGAGYIIGYLTRKNRAFVDTGTLFMGIVVAAIGIWIFLHPDDFTDFIPKLFGAFILISGILNLGRSFRLTRYYSLWWLSLIFSIITIGIGSFLIFNATLVKELTISFIGVFLIYNGVTNIWTRTRVVKYVNNVNQEKNAIDVEAEVVDESEKK